MRGRFALVVVALGLVLVACSSARDRPTTVPAATEQAATPAAPESTEQPLLPVGSDIPAILDATSARMAALGSMRIHQRIRLETIGANVDYDFDTYVQLPDKANATVRVNGALAFEMVVSSGVAYLTEDGTKWKCSQDIGGEAMSEIGLSTDYSGSAVLEVLKGSGRLIGEEASGHQSMRHLRATLPARVYLAAISDTEGGESFRDALSAVNSGTFVIDSWIGEDDAYIHRITVNGTYRFDGVVYSVNGTTDFVEFNNPVKMPVANYPTCAGGSPHA